MNIQTLGKKISQKVDALIAKTKLRATHNKFLLYFVLFLVLADLLIFAVAKDFIYIGIYILIGFIVKFFTKNMLIILIVSMIITNAIRYGSSISVKEGLQSKDKNSNILENAIKEELSKFGDDEISYLKSVKNGDLEGLEGLSKEEQDIFEKMKEMASNEDAVEVINDLEEEIDKNDISDDIEEVKEKEGMKNGDSASKKVEGLTRKVESLTLNNRKIKEAQNKLISSMKNLEPMLSQAETFMKQFANK